MLDCSYFYTGFYDSFIDIDRNFDGTNFLDFFKLLNTTLEFVESYPYAIIEFVKFPY
jgi:hypothetical protein